MPANDTSNAAAPGTVVIASIENCRDLGGYPTPFGLTQPHRFLRSGNTGGVSPADARLLSSWNLSRVLDLRGPSEAVAHPDAFAGARGVRYKGIPLHDTNLHDPQLAPQHTGDSMDDFLVNGYLTMLGNRQAVRKIFKFFSHAKPHQCVLFHCAAGMDRTGVISMLLLGLVGASRDCIRADYGYSFGSAEVINQLVFGQAAFPWTEADSDPAHANPLAERNLWSAENGTNRRAARGPLSQTGAHREEAARPAKGATYPTQASREAARDTRPADPAAHVDPLQGLDASAIQSLRSLCDLAGNVYDRLLDAYGSVEKYLEACGCKPRELERVRAHLLEP